MTVSAYASTAGGYQTLPSPVDVGKQVILTTFSPVMTHNNIRDTLVNLLRGECHNVKVEPQLQKINEGDCLNPTTITGDQARLDISLYHVAIPTEY